MAEKSRKIQSSKASLNTGSGYIPYKNTKKNQRKIKSAVKGINWFVVLLVLVLSIALGAGAFFIVSKDDCFTLNGAQEITVEMNLSEDESEFYGTYVDTDKVKVIEFGKDISNKVTVETDMTVNTDGSYSVTDVGTYYIKYKVDSIKYGKIFTIEKIRLINFIEPEVSEEKEQVGGQG